MSETNYEVDLGAEKVIAAEKEGTKIAIERYKVSLLIFDPEQKQYSNGSKNNTLSANSKATAFLLC